MTTRSVLVINPNTSPSVTDAITRAASSVTLPGISFVTGELSGGPPVIESDEQHHRAAELLAGTIAAQVASGYDGVIIACHGDPGLVAAREQVKVPVLGIGETSMLAAAAATRSFGVVSLGPEVVARKRRQLRATGVADRCVTVEPTGTGVLHAVSGDGDHAPYVAAARAAIAKGADMLVLGCAGMVPVRDHLIGLLGVPVIEPVLTTCLAVAGLLGCREAHRTGECVSRPADSRVMR